MSQQSIPYTHVHHNQKEKWLLQKGPNTERSFALYQSSHTRIIYSVSSEARTLSDLSTFCHTPLLEISTTQCYYIGDQAAQTSEGHPEHIALTCTFQSYRLFRRLIITCCGNRNIAVFMFSASPTGQYSEGGTFSATCTKNPWEQN